jgi:hypothetical protein
MIDVLRVLVVIGALCSSLWFASGCASRQHEDVYIEDTTTSNERPAVSLQDETSFWDAAGEVLVIILVVGITVGAILLPIFIL